MKSEAHRAAAAERLLKKEGMPPEPLPFELEQPLDSTFYDYPDLRAVLDDADLTMEDLARAVSRNPDGFQRWIRATNGVLH